MTDDMLAAGPDRPPLGTPWLVAGAVALLVLASAGTLRATGHLHRPRAAASPTPSPAVFVPPLETIAPTVDPAGHLIPDPLAIKAPRFAPGSGVHLTLSTSTGVYDRFADPY